MKYRYAVTTAVTSWQGDKVVLNRGVAWHASDPFVKANPDLFVDEPPVVLGHVVESASRAPGEKRSTKRA
jgi:hypothetical protein